MSIEFNIDEIFEMAERIERNGAMFYRKAAENTELTSSKGLLLKLAKMEDDHEHTFTKMRSRYSSSEWQNDPIQPDDEVALYLRAIADGHVFNVRTNPVDDLTGNETMEQILRTAIKLEEDSIIFYLGMKDIVPDDLGRQHMDKIIKEERAHIVILSRELANL